MPDILQNARPGCDTDPRPDQDGDLIVEDVLSRSSVGPVDADRRHRLVLLQGDFVDPGRVKRVKLFGLSRPATQSVTKCSGPVAHLADMDANIWVLRARGNSKRMPLGRADAGYIDQKPLAGFIPHARFLELDFQSVVRMSYDLGDSCRSSGPDLTVNPLDQINAKPEKLPTPAFVANAVGPKRVAGEGRIR